MSDRLIILDQLQERILRHAARAHPHECCGLIAGYPGIALEVYVCPNDAEYPERQFSVDAGIHYAIDRMIEESGHRLIAIYHSHPGGQRELSAGDIEVAIEHGPELVHILAHREARADAIYSLRAFRIVDRAPVAIPLEG